MTRPSEIDALVAHFGSRDAVTETDGGWWSSCPVALETDDGPPFCGKGMFVKLLEDGSVRFEPVCGHSVQEVSSRVWYGGGASGPLNVTCQVVSRGWTNTSTSGAALASPPPFHTYNELPRIAAGGVH